LAKNSERLYLFDVLEAVKGESLSQAALSISPVVNCAAKSLEIFQQAIISNLANKSLSDLALLLPQESGVEEVEPQKG
jgi:hypothetical protein